MHALHGHTCWQFFAADRLSAAALSHRLVMACYHARAHVRQSTPYQTGKGSRNGNTRLDAERRTDELHRNTIDGNTPTVQRSEQIPISRGAAEQATGSDQCIDYAGRTRTRPNASTSGWEPNVGRPTSANISQQGGAAAIASLEGR